MKNANLTAEQIRTALSAGKSFVVFNYVSGEVSSLHKSHDSAMRKAAKLGFRHNVHNLRVGYAY